MKKFMQKLKTKWDIRSNWDFWMIMIVFSLAGLNVSFGRKPIFALLGIGEQTPLWAKTILYILLIFPIYQASLLFYGFLLGQFDFFWKKQQQIVAFFKRKLAGTHTASSK